MKRITAAILIAVMLLASCASGGGSTHDSTHVIYGKDTTTIADSNANDLPSGTVSTPKIPDISGLKSIGDDLWEIPLPSYLYDNEKQYSSLDISSRGDYLLATYRENSDSAVLITETIVLLFDIKTCKLTAETRVSSMSRISLLDDGYVSVIDDTSLKTDIYDPSLKIESEYPAIHYGFYSTLAFVTSDRSKFVWYSESSHVMMKDLKSGDVTDLGTVVSDPSYCSEHNGIVYLLCYNNGIQVNYALDLSDATLKRLTKYDGSSPVGSFQPAFVHGELSSVVMIPDNDGNIYMIDDIGSEYVFPLDYRDGVFILRAITEENSDEIVLYSLNNSKRITFKFPYDPDNSYIGLMRIADYGEVFIDATVNYSEPKLLLWLPDYITQGESAGISVTNRNGLLSRADSLRKKIENDYGIKVFYGEEGSDFNAFDYVGEVVTDEIRIYNAMTILSSTLSRFPQGIFTEMLDRELSAFNFYLCGTLSGTVTGSLDTALAITFTDYETMTKRIACDIGGYYILDQTIAHELMHVMDDAILNAEIETGIPYYSLWYGLLPDGFDYYGYYVDSEGFEPTDTSFTVMGEMNEDDIYFIDTYSKTYATEDRARIMEYLFKTEHGILSPFIRGEHLIEKCRALCIILRKVFPSVAAENQVFWESGLGEIDENTLDDLIARYEDYLNRYPAVG